MLSKTTLATVSAFIALSLSLSSAANAAQQAGSSCPGCVDETEDPATGLTGAIYHFGFLKGSYTINVTVFKWDGTCVWKAIEGEPSTLYCDDATPCSPRLKIDIIVDGDIPLASEFWEVYAAGTICGVDQSSYHWTLENDDEEVLHDGRHRVSCGGDCVADVTYTIELWEPPLIGSNYLWGTRTTDVDATLDCSGCGASAAGGGQSGGQ